MSHHNNLNHLKLLNNSLNNNSSVASTTASLGWGEGLFSCGVIRLLIKTDFKIKIKTAFWLLI